MIQLLMLPVTLATTIVSAVASAMLSVVGGVFFIGVVIIGVVGLSWWFARM